MSGAERPSAALLITGSELLLGLVADRNTSFLARALDRLGVDLERVLVVGDGEAEIAEGLETLRSSTSRSGWPYGIRTRPTLIR